jgi:manganese transport protein
MQLPFAMFPLLQFTSCRKWMGDFRSGWFLRLTGWGSFLLITALDVYGLGSTIEKAWAVLAGE